MALPSPPPIFNATPESILQEAHQIIDQAKAVQDSLASTITPDAATFDNTLLPIAEEENNRLYRQAILIFYGHVSPDEGVRQAARDASKLFSELLSDLGARDDIAVLVRAVCEKDEPLDEECQKYLNRQMMECKRGGLHLPAEQRDRVHDIDTELTNLKIGFETNHSDENGFIWLTTDQLEGLPAHILWRLMKDDNDPDRHRLTFQFSYFKWAQQYVSNATVRRQIYLAYMNKCNQNVPILEKAIILRDEAARLLGHANHAEYRLQTKMESSPQRVNDFLDDARARLVPKGQAELERLKQLKADDLKEKCQKDNGKFYLWDQAFYTRLLIEKEYAIDQDKVSEYFPLDWVIEKMLDIFADLFGLTFTAYRTNSNDGLTWHEDVKMFAVYDEYMENGEWYKEFKGYLYMDLHPRPGKTPQISCLSIHPGYNTANTRLHPCTCLITNFPKSNTTKPTLVTHSDLWQIFHELGHGIHDLVSKTRFTCFHGPATAQDFCEAPSQMLEKFCWTPQVLKMMGTHWSRVSDEAIQLWQEQHPGEDLPNNEVPDELIEALIKSRDANQALFWLQSLHFAVFDMKVHQPASHEEVKNLDTMKLWNSLRKDIMLMDGPEEEEAGDWNWGHGHAVLGHIFSGYDAGFYSYLTSQVYACDMFYSNFAEAGNGEEGDFDDGVLSQTQGMRWRREVLEKGGSRDEMEGIRRFLGREPTGYAWMRELGLAS